MSSFIAVVDPLESPPPIPSLLVGEGARLRVRSNANRYSGAALLATALALGPSVQAAELSPTEIVRELYRLELGPKGDMSGEPLYSFVDAPIQRRLSRDFRALVAKMTAYQSKTNEAILDWDPIADGNGAVPLGVKVETTSPNGDKAEAVARFHIAGGERHSVTYRFVREDGAWKIDDILEKSEDVRKDIEQGLAAK